MLNTKEPKVDEAPVTLGLRLEPRLGSQLASLSRRTGRSKSDIAREAVREYLDRHDEDAEFRRQVALLNQGYSADDRARRAVMTSDWLRGLDAEDGGYDWGPDGPPV